MFLDVPNTPSWIGYIIIIPDNSIKQKVGYLPPINHSPTDKSVVYMTLRQAQKIARECMQNYMQVTYDLDIAKWHFRYSTLKTFI